MYRYIIFFIFLFSCEEEISLDFPLESTKLVIEGGIENGFPPFVILTKNAGYFDNIDTNTYIDLFVNDASVQVWTTNENGTNDTIRLDKIPDYPIYTSLLYWSQLNNENPYAINDPFFQNWSKPNREYNLVIKWNNKTITSSTTIPMPTTLDCLWVVKDEYNNRDFKYDIKGIYNDPIEIENNILIKTRRSEHWGVDSISFNNAVLKDKRDNKIDVVDVGIDILYNGLEYETSFPRKNEGNIASASFNSSRIKYYNNEKDSIEIPHDIAIVKFCQIDEPALKFWRSIIRQFGSNGNPFQEPLNIVSNINEGYGGWTGYGAVYYKIPIIDGKVIKSPLPLDSIEITDVF